MSKYNGWGRIGQFNPNILSCMILAECSFALSWRSTIFLLLMIVRHFFKRFSCSLVLSFSRLWIGMCWGQVLILKYFLKDWIPLILLNHLDQGLMSILVWVHLSMIYCQNKTFKTSFGLDSHFGHKHKKFS